MLGTIKMVNFLELNFNKIIHMEMILWILSNPRGFIKWVECTYDDEGWMLNEQHQYE